MARRVCSWWIWTALSSTPELWRKRQGVVPAIEEPKDETKSLTPRHLTVVALL